MTRSKSVPSLPLALAALLAAALPLEAQTVQFPATAERWGVFEIVLTGPSTGNPYVDVTLSATFTQGAVSKNVPGFYDGGGTYRIRFMPHLEGAWSFTTSSNVAALSGKTGSFTSTSASAGNRGPVRVRDQFHFQYEDGTPFHHVGTTAYGWTNQPAARQDQTLQTLAGQKFNKLRFLVMPKYYTYSTETPPIWPYEGSPHAWNFDRPVYAFFQNYDLRVRQLRDMGLEADIILLNPYDGWGLKDIHQNQAQEDRFLRYVIARISAYRNVWWSMSNEYELWDTNDAYWDRVFQLVRDSDPYGHLRSIHNMHQVYDHSKPWVTHASLQQVSVHMDNTRSYRNQYGKPIVWDEVGYEGNISESWGRLTPQEMTRRFWIGLKHGSYVGHGETYQHPQNILWWSKGGVLYGQSPARIAFLSNLVRDHVPGLKLDPLAGDTRAAHHGTRCYLYYFDDSTATSRSFSMPAGITYRATVVDTWNMVKTDAGLRTGTFTLSMPANPYMAVLLVQEGEPVPPPPPDPNFVKGVNFNGAAVTIDNNPWSSYAQALSSGLSFAGTPNVWTSQITPNPATDPDTSSMLNSAVWAQASNLAFSQTLANGTYDVFFWVLENHQTNYRSFAVRLEGATAAASIGSLPYATWQKYGPYRVTIGDGDLDVELVRSTGDPHLMGMAIFSAGTTAPSVSITATDASASEAGTNPGTFTLTRTGSTSSALTVNLTIGGTATNGTDYASIAATAAIPAGSASAAVTVTPANDTAVEGSETVVLTVAGGTGYTVGSPGSATVTIADDDSAPPPPPSGTFVKGVNFNGGPVTIEGNAWLSHAQALSGGLSFTVNPNVWTSQVSPTPAVDGDNHAMLNTAVWLQNSFGFSQTLANGSYSVYLWVLENHQSNFRSFDVRMEGATVQAGIGTLSYGSWVKVGPYAVTVGDGALSIDLVRNYGDPHVMGMAIFSSGAPPPATPVVTVGAADGNASEAGDPGSFTLTRTGSTSAALAVSVSAGGTATSGADYSALGTTVTIPAGASSATVAVTPVNDTAVEGAETVVLAVAAGAGYTAGTPGSATVTIADDDSNPPPPPPPPSGTFLKGINFNGGAVTIEGNAWLSHAQALSSGLSFTTNPNVWTSQVAPTPAVDADTRAMLNTAVWSTGSFGFNQTLANGSYQVVFWVLENHQSNFRSFDVKLEGATAAAGIGTMAYGVWTKYGPYAVTVSDGALSVDLLRNYGDPHVMGMAIFGGSTAPPPPPAADLLLHWMLDETSGTTAADASGNGNVGTLSAGGPVWTTGRLGGGLDLDGEGDFASAPASASLNSASDQITVALWVYKRADAPTWGALAGRRYGTTWEDLWLVYYNNSGGDEYAFGLTTSDGTEYLTGPSSAGDVNQWVHLAAVYDGGWLILYRNGQEVARAPHSGTIPAQSSPLVVGAGDNGTAGDGEFVDAILDDLRIYGRALSASEVAALAAGGGTSTQEASVEAAALPTRDAGSGSEGEEGCGALGLEVLLVIALAALRRLR